MMFLRSAPHFPSSGDFVLTGELKLLITKNTVMRGQVLVIGERVIEFATGADFPAYQNVPW